MRRWLTAYCLLLLLAGCGGGGGSSSSSPSAPTGAQPTTTTSPPTTPGDIVLTTATSTITIPAGSLETPGLFTIDEQLSPTSAPPNPDAILASSVIQLTSPSARFATDGGIVVTIAPTSGAPDPDALVLHHSTGLWLTIWLPSAASAPRSPTSGRPVRVAAPWLGLPGSIELALYHLGGRVNTLGLFTDDPASTLDPHLTDHYRLFLHGLNGNHLDLETLRLALRSLGRDRAELSVDYDERQRADVSAAAILNLLNQPGCLLAGSRANLQIVGYSYGGIVARCLAEQLGASDSPLQVDSVVTINTPNRGAPISASLIASLTLTVTNGRGRRWSPDTPALHTIDGSDGLLTALATAQRTYAWTAIGGTAFPTLPPTRDLATEFLRFAGNLLYPAMPSDGLVADWSAMPVTPLGKPITIPLAQTDRHHVNVLASENLNRLCRAITAPFGEGGRRISRGSQWAPLNGVCYVQPNRPSFSGRYHGYESDQTDNLAGDRNGRRDIFLSDQVLGTTELASVLSDGSQMNGTSRSASVSYDGRFVVFASNNTRSLTGERLGHWNVYLRDRLSRTTTCLTVDGSGTEVHPDDAGDSDQWDLGIAMTPDASVIAYAAFGVDRSTHVYRLDRTTGQRTVVDVSPFGQAANWNSNHPTISDDGQRIGFQTLADNLDDRLIGSRFGHEKVYVWDQTTNRLTPASVHPDGTAATTDAELPMLSGDGQSIVFSSADTALTNPPTPAGGSTVFVRRLASRTTEVASIDASDLALAGFNNYPSTDRFGRYVSFVRWTDQANPSGPSDVWLVDLARASRRSTCLTMSATGEISNGPCYWPTLADDATNLHFASLATSFDASNTTGIVQDYVVANPFLILPSMARDRSVAHGRPESTHYRFESERSATNRLGQPPQQSILTRPTVIKRTGWVTTINGRISSTNHR